MSRERRKRRRDRFGGPEDLNPMNYISNLSDVMLVLAVGIMVALILHWNVQLETPDSAAQQNGTDQQSIQFTEDELEGQQELPEDMTHMGEVYYDEESGTYYIVEEDTEAAGDVAEVPESGTEEDSSGTAGSK